ncbi:XRE family transcriptional regulator [Lactobacillus sp. 3B(2020)]|uniref:XRE family transcriptional regulator n=1 Tax=Lactobacillus sp. 3B(2020) TaxID=2695882 RepID=UPI0015DE4285|nr:XRE family transcriptional regulator [Lactobacillus sp. 3B(2020)]QLL69132.1 XRE family transcriptional regulator [Lactobacillus sp. 3B(2020)]
MAMTIDEFLQINQLTAADVARASGIRPTTLSAAFKRPVTTWTVKIINALALASHKDPGSVLSELQKPSFKLVIDRENLTIQGVKFENRFDFQVVEFAVKSNVMEGWEPSRENVLSLKRTLKEPNPKYEAQFNDIFGD